MYDLEEKGSRRYKIKYVSKLVAIILISTSAILGVIFRIYLYITINFAMYHGVTFFWELYLIYYGVPIFVIIIIIIANTISLPGFIALGIYSYFLYLRLEYYLYLRSETKFDPKLRFRTFYIALIEVFVFFLWCLFSGFLFNVLIMGPLIIALGVLTVMLIVPGMYYVLERLK